MRIIPEPKKVIPPKFLTSKTMRSLCRILKGDIEYLTLSCIILQNGQTLCIKGLNNNIEEYKVIHLDGTSNYITIEMTLKVLRSCFCK